MLPKNVSTWGHRDGLLTWLDLTWPDATSAYITCDTYSASRDCLADDMERTHSENDGHVRKCLARFYDISQDPTGPHKITHDVIGCHTISHNSHDRHTVTRSHDHKITRPRLTGDCRTQSPKFGASPVFAPLWLIRARVFSCRDMRSKRQQTTSNDLFCDDIFVTADMRFSVRTDFSKWEG